MKKIMFGGMFLVILITIGFVFANPIQYNTNQELKEEIQEAILEKNYSSFVELHQGIETKGKAFDLINEENFALFAEMKQAIIEEDFERAREIKEEIGINRENRQTHKNMQKGTGKKESGKGSQQGLQQRLQKQDMSCQN
jgi:hypothetical protein